MKNKYIIILFSIILGLNTSFFAAPTKERIAQATRLLKQKSNSHTPENFILKQVVEIWDLFISERWDLMQALKMSLHSPLSLNSLESLINLNNELNPTDAHSYSIINGLNKLISFRHQNLSPTVKESILVLTKAANFYINELKKKHRELILQIKKQLYAQEKKRKALRQNPQSRETPKIATRHSDPRLALPPLDESIVRGDFSSFKAPKKLILQASLNGLDLQACGVGFYCDRQTGAMCGWKSVCNALSLANAAEGDGPIAERIKRTPFHSNVFVARKKHLFESATGRRGDDWTNDRELAGFGHFLEPNQGKFKKALFLGPTTIGEVDLNSPMIKYAGEALTKLRRLAQSTDELITFLKNARIALINKPLTRYSHGNLSISTSEMIDIEECALKNINESQKIITMFDRGGIIIWVNYHGNHWTCQCLFKDNDGSPCFGMVDSLSPGNVHLHQYRSKSLLYLVTYGLPIDELNVKILKRVYSL
jgi:hypothetical protein